MPRFRLLAVAVASVSVLAALPGAASASVPEVTVCLETGVLPAVGTCPESKSPAAEPPEKQREKKRSKTRRRGCRDASLRPSRTNTARIRKATLCLLNRERRKRGRKALRAHSTLAKAARRYGGKMVKEEFFAHVSPAGSTLRSRVKRTSYLESRRIRRWSLGENLAWGTGDRATPRQIVRSWMRSPGHKRNIIDREFRDIGLGVVRGIPEAIDAPRGATYVTVFGQRVRR